jgi:hypothetical protein
MSSVPSRPRWHFLFTPRWLGWHAFAVVATIGMLWLGDWQFHRAEGGNALSWAYTFEWPIFAIFGVVFWAKTIRDEFRGPAGDADAGAAAEVELPGGLAGAHSPRKVSGSGTDDAGSGDDEEADDPELAAYNAYLTRLNEQVKGHGRWHGLR